MKLMRLQAVIDTTGLSRPTIYKRMALDLFPTPVQLGERAVAWVSDEIEMWVQARVDERDERLKEQSALAGRPLNEAWRPLIETRA
ncbi:MAG: AlpA family phage regulatory protein [Marinobacter sp.]|jgi:prophage regulatory protein|nr:AlpA family phage regulatory protein [Alcanivoracaceae bacterium]MDX5328600.1 AlpA family phage regulatory protein [Marinobacter sp.]PKM22600.1 MAG: AlpA family transcriptional regulator [Gammaproteobacteria bacterium HGW-Gammaproteobacteria-14]